MTMRDILDQALKPTCELTAREKRYIRNMLMEQLISIKHGAECKFCEPKEITVIIDKLNADIDNKKGCRS